MAVKPTEPLPGISLFSGSALAGIRRTSGYVVEEFLAELRGPNLLRTYREMGDNDPIVGGLLTLIGGLFRTIEWSAEPRDPENPDDVAAAEFVQEEIENLQPTLKEQMSEALDFFQYGFAIAEVVYMRGDDGKVRWKEWRFMAPETRDRWVFDIETDEPLAFVQRPPSDYKERIIPLAKCIHLRTTRRKGNPEGRSILRTAWRDWYYKVRLEEIEAIGCERDLAGLPVMRIPLEYMKNDAPAEHKAVYELAKQTVRNVRRDEHEGLVLPSDKYPNTTDYVVDFTLTTTGGSRALDISKIIERHDSRIAMSALADFLLLGHQQVGSFSLSSDKTSMFSVVFGGYADVLSSELTRQAADRLTSINAMPGRAIIRHSDFEKEDLANFTTALDKMVKNGVIVAGDPALEEYVRKLMNLPPPDEDWLAEEEKRKEEELERLEEAAAAGQTAGGGGGVRGSSEPQGPSGGTGVSPGNGTTPGFGTGSVPEGADT